jgi:mono/diheme cytochrome c family protein
VQLAEPYLIARAPEFSAALSAIAGDADAQVATQVFLAFRAAAQAGAAQLPAVFLEPQRPLPLVAKLIERDRNDKSLGTLGESAKKGRLVYETLCIACHGPDAGGVRIDNKLIAPQLTKSAWFANGGNVPILARVLLKGQTGPIDGVSYGEGLMPPVEKSHTDEQIAQVLSYIGERWHGWKKPAEASDVARVREEVKARTNPWTSEELKAVK